MEESENGINLQELRNDQDAEEKEQGDKEAKGKLIPFPKMSADGGEKVIDN